MESAAVEHANIITKSRRTKRQRSAIAITSASSTGGGGGGSDGGEGGGGVGFENNNLYSSSSTASATGNCNSDDQDIMSEITTEEKDMANCLIMLARGTTSVTPTSTMVKVPVPNRYECKTCNKIFSSFQALGGHRASHKKPKPTLPESQSQSPSLSPSPSPRADHNQQTKNINEGQNQVVVRVHECSICGSEFPSGQALGGHMRRHRAPPSASNPSGRPIESGGAQQPRNVLPLDLNLPAPDDDDNKIEEAKSLGQNIETATFHRVLPTLALVDCHY